MNRTYASLRVESNKCIALQCYYADLITLFHGKNVDSEAHAVESRDLLEECTGISENFVILHNISLQTAVPIDDQIRVNENNGFLNTLTVAIRDLDVLITEQHNRHLEIVHQIENFQEVHPNVFFRTSLQALCAILCYEQKEYTKTCV